MHFDQTCRPSSVPHCSKKSCTQTSIVWTVIVLNNPVCLFLQNHTCSAWMKSQLHDVHSTTAALITAFQARAISPSETHVSSVSLYHTNTECTHDTVATCVMCHVNVCSLGSKSSLLKQPSHKLSPVVSSSPNTKSFGVIPESSTKAESKLSPIRSLRAVTISLEVLDENCPD